MPSQAVVDGLLQQNVPNPFNPATVISYHVPSRTTVDLRIYDLSGRLVRVLRNAVVEEGGGHEVGWDGRDDSGTAQVSGVYVYRLAVGDRVETRKMVLLR